LQISIPEPEQLQAYPAERVRVQNTFIHVASPTPDSLERVAQSCPSTHIGRLRDVFNEERGDESAKQVLCLEEVLFESMPSTPEPLQLGGMGVPPCAMSPEKLSQARCELEWPTPGMLQEMGFPGQAPLAGHPDMNCWPMPPPQLGNYQHQMALPPQPMPFSGSVLQPNVFPVEAMLPMPSEPAPGSAELPSVGSKGHGNGECKPCAFLHVKGCDNGAMCKFCHICDAGEKKRRQKAKKAAFRGGA